MGLFSIFRKKPANIPFEIAYAVYSLTGLFMMKDLDFPARLDSFMSKYPDYKRHKEKIVFEINSAALACGILSVDTVWKDKEFAQKVWGYLPYAMKPLTDGKNTDNITPNPIDQAICENIGEYLNNFSAMIALARDDETEDETYHSCLIGLCLEALERVVGKLVADMSDLERRRYLDEFVNGLSKPVMLHFMTKMPNELAKLKRTL